MNTSMPIFTPILKLLHSRKFVTAVLSLLLTLFFWGFPQFEPIREEITLLIGTLASVLIFSISYEDGKRFGTELVEAVDVEIDDEELVKRVTDALLETLLGGSDVPLTPEQREAIINQVKK